jgi:hypothetical protein
MRRATKALIAITTLQLLSACSSTSLAQSTEAPQYKILILHMTTNGEGHQVLAADVVASQVPLTISEASSDTLNFVVTDSNGAQLIQGGIADPRVIRSPLAPPGEPQQGHKIIVLPDTEYLLRLPYQSTMKVLYLVKGKIPVSATATAKDRVQALAHSVAVTSIDLGQWLSTAKH